MIKLSEYLQEIFIFGKTLWASLNLGKPPVIKSEKRHLNSTGERCSLLIGKLRIMKVNIVLKSVVIDKYIVNLYLCRKGKHYESMTKSVNKERWLHLPVNSQP